MKRFLARSLAVPLAVLGLAVGPAQAQATVHFIGGSPWAVATAAITHYPPCNEWRSIGPRATQVIKAPSQSKPGRWDIAAIATLTDWNMTVKYAEGPDSNNPNTNGFFLGQGWPLQDPMPVLNWRRVKNGSGVLALKLFNNDYRYSFAWRATCT